jgi:hypothetical protein
MGALTLPATSVCTIIRSVTFLETVRFNFTYCFMLCAHAYNVTSHVKLRKKYTFCAVNESQGISVQAVSFLEIACTTFSPGIFLPDSYCRD